VCGLGGGRMGRSRWEGSLRSSEKRPRSAAPQRSSIGHPAHPPPGLTFVGRLIRLILSTGLPAGDYVAGDPAGSPVESTLEPRPVSSRDGT